MENATHCYTARKKCGCLVGITVDMPDHPKDTAEWVAECIAAGWTIERMTIEEGRNSCAQWGCTHNKPTKQQAELFT